MSTPEHVYGFGELLEVAARARDVVGYADQALAASRRVRSHPDVDAAIIVDRSNALVRALEEFARETSTRADQLGELTLPRVRGERHDLDELRQTYGADLLRAGMLIPIVALLDRADAALVELAEGLDAYGRMASRAATSLRRALPRIAQGHGASAAADVEALLRDVLADDKPPEQ